MWLFTRYGFFSVVNARKNGGRHGNPVDTTRMMIRARDKAHLESLIERFPAEFGDVGIHQSEKSDYRYRVLLEKGKRVTVISGLAQEQDYDNFKNEVAKCQSKGSHEYLDCLHRIWSIMHEYQNCM